MKTLLLGLSLALTAGAASAATMTADFDLRSGGNAYNQDFLSYSSNGVDLTVSGIVCDDGQDPNHGSCSSAPIDRDSRHGIYLKQPNDSHHEVDGRYSNEYLMLSFNPDVTLSSVKFSYWDRWDNADLYTDDGGTWKHEGRISSGSSDVYQYNFAGTYAGGMFLLGAREYFDAWKLKAVSVELQPSAVPLPAAGWMLIASLAGLGAMRRRRAAA